MDKNQMDFQSRKPKIKNTFLFLLKLIFALSLTYWMVASGKLDFKTLSIYSEHPHLTWSLFSFWLFAMVILAAIRWWFLLRGMNLSLSIFEAIRLNSIGLFFNTIVPGAVSGDFIKAYYVCRGQSPDSKLRAIFTLLLDRVMGVLGLFFVCSIAVMANWNVVLQYEPLRPFIFLSLGVIVGFIFFCLVVLIPGAENKIPFLRNLLAFLYRIQLFKQLIAAIKTYRSHPLSLVSAFLASIVIQTAHIFLYLYTTFKMNGEINIGLLSTILPIGIITIALPISPGGLGVGHLAFEYLYKLVGLSGGANIFNVIFIANFTLSFLGAIPYVFSKFDQQLNLSTSKSAGG